MCVYIHKHSHSWPAAFVYIEFTRNFSTDSSCLFTLDFVCLCSAASCSSFKTEIWREWWGKLKADSRKLTSFGACPLQQSRLRERGGYLREQANAFFAVYSTSSWSPTAQILLNYFRGIEDNGNHLEAWGWTVMAWKKKKKGRLQEGDFQCLEKPA